MAPLLPGTSAREQSLDASHLPPSHVHAVAVLDRHHLQLGRGAWSTECGDAHLKVGFPKKTTILECGLSAEGSDSVQVFVSSRSCRDFC